MNKLNRLVFFVLSFLSLFFLTESCRAGIDHYTNSTSSGRIHNNDILSVKDEKFKNSLYNWNSISNISVKNAVALRVIDQDLVTFQFSCDATVEIDYYTSPTQTQPTSVTKTLHVNYNPNAGTTYKALDVYDFSDMPGFTGAYQVAVKVISITNSLSIAPDNLPKVLQLSCDIVIDRQYNFQPALPLGVRGTIISNQGTGANAATNQLFLQWSHVQGAEEYDVEWTTVDKGSEYDHIVNQMRADTSTYNTGADPVKLDSIFRNNASRITTSGNEFKLSLLYHDDYLVVRVRQVKDTTGGIRLTGNWDYQLATAQTNGDIFNFWYLKWNEPNLNWQYSAGFAEEGKKKEVISYFDGTLRGRQTVTMNNADSVSLAQEKIYDQFGRPAASILPAPFKDSITVGTSKIPVKAYLHYVPMFNLNAAGNPYSAANVQGTLYGLSCAVNPDPLATGAGASKYYSGKNAFINDQRYNSYIPDALGYPLSVTQYTADNTGRIKIQGGVGGIFQPAYGALNTKGKATRYYYAKPEQWELDQLFGNDAGYAEQYFKNMVVDPNGQISISYLNGSGKTIATALTGTAPANLDTLASYTSHPQKQNIAILNPGQFTYDGTALKLTATTTYLASVTDNSAVLKYNIQKLVDHYPGGSFNVCSNCYYKLTIKVKDDCNNDAISPITTPVKIGSDTANCSAAGIYTDSLRVNFGQIGEYHISFEFAFDNTVIEHYADSLISKGQAQGFITKQFDYIKNNYLHSINASGCFSDCRTCKVLLGTDSAFRKTLVTQFIALNLDSNSVKGTGFTQWADSLYTSLKNHCDSIQGTCDMSPCSAAQSLMEQDISPGGQFALFDANNNALEPEVNVLSLHWADVFGPGHMPSTLSTTDSITLDDGSVMTPYDASFSLQLMLKYWNPAWASKFLPYHPEYCKLQFCNSMSVYENWDERVKQFINSATNIPAIPNASGAAANLQYSETNSHWLLGADPFFQYGKPGYAYASAMQADLDSYTSNVLKVTDPSAQVIGLSPYVNFSLYCTGSATPANWATCTPSGACKVPDREWTSYRDLYFELKNKYYTILRNLQCGNLCPVGVAYTNNPAPNGCPATTDFVIEPYNGASTCGAGTQAVKLSYAAGVLTQNVTVSIYYPSGVNTTGLPATVQLSQANPYAVFCIPSALAVSDLHIRAVNCTSSGITNNNGYQSNAGTVHVYNDGFYLYEQTYCNGSTGGGTYIFAQGQTYIDLEDSQGNLVPAPNDINVTVNYEQIGCNGTSYFSQTFTILAGATSSSQFFYDADDEVNCSGECIEVTTAPQCVTSITGGTLQSGWNFCQGSGNNPPLNCPSAFAYKDSRFPDAVAGNQPANASQLGAASAASSSALTAAVAGACSGNADTWMARLKPGTDALGATQAQLDNLRARFIEICTAGGDIAHPFGVSDITGDAAPANGSTYSSFGAAIKAVLLGGGNFTPAVNPWLIDSPYPYAPVQQSAAKSVGQTNADICTVLNQFKTNYTNMLANPGLYTDQGFYNYLMTTYGAAMNISAGELGALLKSCNQCNYLLAQSVTLPVFMDPPAQGCITNAAFTAALADMNSQFGGALSSADPNYATILTNFMNWRWGFSLAYSDYAAYISSGSTALLCNSTPYTETTADPYACLKEQTETAVVNGLRAYNNYIAGQRQKFRADYIATCSAAQASANLATKVQNYHYTLYYYDQADNLVRTVPPEGVSLLDNKQMQWADTYRSQGSPNCNYSGPTTNSDVNTALNTVSATLAATTGKAIEMWLYQSDSYQSGGAFMALTPDKQYIFQVYVKGSRMAVEVFPTFYSSAAPGGIALVHSSVHYTLDLSSQLPLNPWLHVVLQSPAFTTQGSMAIFVNGVQQTPTGDILFHAPWGLAAGTSAFTFTQQNMAALKHLRFYNRLLDTAEISANARDNCFGITATATAANTAWYRFNVPAPGSFTTIAAGSTVESKINPVYPAHTLKTTYAYNSTNQVVQQNSPDGGTNRFWYDLLSRLNISQNDKQLPNNQYSYTLYDALGRITEVGQKTTSTNIKGPNYTDSVYLANSTITGFNSSGTNAQITDTYYDSQPTAANGIHALTQNNLRKRVALSTYRDNQSDTVKHATYYNYDLDGNVATLYQQVAGLGIKQIDYEYDLVSGKVNFVRYQDGHPDQFYYRYNYDAENRLTDAWSAIRAIVNPYEGSYLLPDYSKLDAHYNYYLHGPLARTELGDQLSKVQGMDYAYTLQGWLKGVNGNTLANDMGQDGTPIAGVAGTIPKDAYAYSLGYYTGDYTPIGGSTANAFGITYQSQSGDITGQSLYNGNISNTTLAISAVNSGAPVGYTYHYDQLNRLKAMRQHLLSGSGSWNRGSITQAYAENITYDGMGNILTYNRHGANVAGMPLAMDSLAYGYDRDINGCLINNRLRQIKDAVPAGNYPNDLHNQPDSNYHYDAIGSLISDTQAGINKIDWTVYGKIQNIYKSADTIKYSYGPGGQRVSKIYHGLTTFYVRDASGNIMGQYDNAGSTINWREQHLYGTSRLGLLPVNINLSLHHAADTAVARWDLLGLKQYELKNQLGNVNAEISDRRLQTAGGSTLGYYNADIISASDYGPFGLPAVNRNVNFANLRFGFNGKLNDNDIDSLGNWQEYGMRMYLTKGSRFPNVDPLTAKYPWLTPYQFAGDSPIANIDLDGGEPAPVNPGTSEGQMEITSESHYGLHDIKVTNTQKWFWHTGSKDNHAGWYTESDYYNDILKPVAKDYNEWEAGKSNGDKYYDFAYGETRIGRGWQAVIWDIAKDLKENPKYDGWKSYLPIWGPANQAYLDYSTGHWGWGAFNSASALADVLLVESIGKGIAKGGLTALGKDYKWWSSWRSFYGREGFAEAGQQVHHWALVRDGSKSGFGFQWWGKNQMWNLVPMTDSKILGLTGDQIHTLIHGGTVGRDIEFGPVLKYLYGTPSWMKSLPTSIFTKTINGTRQ